MINLVRGITPTSLPVPLITKVLFLLGDPWPPAPKHSPNIWVLGQVILEVRQEVSHILEQLCGWVARPVGAPSFGGQACPEAPELPGHIVAPGPDQSPDVSCEYILRSSLLLEVFLVLLLCQAGKCGPGKVQFRAKRAFHPGDAMRRGVSGGCM